ncbi:MAG: peptidoglycan-binding protein [Rhodobacteraceae bacterium]|jgi:peptidoglycan hydrolase-like protein with peptidoglycan-binding domain|nr:peptidoglycan-binding protein [Paracoccaceae bacterium]
MKNGILTTTALTAALIIGGMGQARADVGSAIAGGIIGGIIGGAIQRDQQRRPRYVVSSGATSAARQLARDVQTALNHFYFNVGAPDGVLGRQSRAGISQYQAYLSFPVTGELAEFERQVLITAYQRSIAGGAEVTRVVQRHRDGQRGLLEVVRDELRGGGSRARLAGAYGLPPEVADAVDEIAASSDPSAEQLVQRSGFVQLADLNGDGRTDYIIDTSVTGSAFWCNAQACTVQVFVSTPDGYVRNDFQSNSATPAAFECLRSSCRLNDTATVSVATAGTSAPAGAVAPPVAAAQPMVQNPTAASPAAAAPAGAVPNFFGGGSGVQQASLASHCNRVALVTSSNGGYTELNAMVDPLFALNEQFCLARSYAIAEGEALVSQVVGATPQSIAAQCQGLEPLLQSHVAALSVQPRDIVLQGVTQFVLTSGMSGPDLSGTARICLSSGYLTDNQTVAIGSALILVALGEASYGELPGHHLMQGIGASLRRDFAVQWFRSSIPADGTALTEVAFRPGPESRNALIRAAVDGVMGGGQPMAPMPTLPVPAAPEK